MIENISKQLEKYELLYIFSSQEEIQKWIIELNDIERENLLNLNIDREKIKFSTTLLLNKELLNTRDYNQRVQILTSIKNAEGYYHLFTNLLKPEFLQSQKFYQDIETLKKAPNAQASLRIIGESSFIHSPYHDEDFELLVTSKDTSNKNCDFLVWDAIADIASSQDSINSSYHKQDIQTIIKYSANSLQSLYSYPKSSINSLAVNPVSLKDIYHLENMKILAQNKEIGNFLYAVMTNSSAIARRDYRTIIREMVEYKDKPRYVFLLCLYAVGEQAAKEAQNILIGDYYKEIVEKNDINELLKKVNEKLNTIDSTIYDEKEVYYLENQPNGIKIKMKNIIGKILPYKK